MHPVQMLLCFATANANASYMDTIWERLWVGFILVVC